MPAVGVLILANVVGERREGDEARREVFDVALGLAAVRVGTRVEQVREVRDAPHHRLVEDIVKKSLKSIIDGLRRLSMIERMSRPRHVGRKPHVEAGRAKNALVTNPIMPAGHAERIGLIAHAVECLALFGVGRLGASDVAIERFISGEHGDRRPHRHAGDRKVLSHGAVLPHDVVADAFGK